MKLFGGIAIAVDGQPLAGRAVQRRRLALLALLAVSRARGGPAAGLSRDKLIAFLWPTADAEIGRRYLSDSMYRINQALDADVIVGTGDTLHLDADRLPSDVVDFHDALAGSRLENAVALYAGPFLDGFHLSDSPDVERWVDGERDRFAAEYAHALDTLGEQATRGGAAPQAAEWFRRLAAHDPYNSRVALRLMTALRDAGQRAAAIQHARVYEQLVQQELELDPDPQVMALAEALRRESVGASAPAISATPLPPSTSDVTAAPAGSAASADPLTHAQPLAPHAGRRQANLRNRRWLLAGAMLVALGIAIPLVRSMAGRDAAVPAPRSVAVLPFVNLSANAGDEYFSDGMTDELIASLGAVDSLTVASRTSAFALKNRQLDVRQIGRELGVATVVEGSVRRADTALRITAQLVDARSGYRLWSATFDRTVDDVFAIQEEIARAIVTQVMGSLDVQPVRPPPRVDIEAYDLYLRGRFAWHERTRAGLERAIQHFDAAIARAPGYSRAYVGLADTYAVTAFYDYRAPREAYPKAEAAALKALELEPRLAAAHATLGYVATYYHLDWTRAEAEFVRAIALDPSYSTAHQWYGNLLTAAGRFAEAEREMRLAQETDPLSLVASAALCWTLHYARRHADALAQCRRTLALSPDYQVALLWGGWALEAMGRDAEAREWIGRAAALSGGNDLMQLALAHAQARAHVPTLRDSAMMVVGALRARAARGEYVPAYEIAKVHLALGDTTQAVRMLERAFVERSHSRAFLRVDPHLDPLRGHSRFRALVARVPAR